MWNILKTEIFIEFNQVNLDNFELYLTDFVTIWMKSYTKDQFLNVMKNSNPCLVINNHDLLTKGIDVLQNPGNLKKVSYEVIAEGIRINVLGSYDFPVKFITTCNEGSKSLKVTQPLVQTVDDLKSSQKELVTMIVRKDKEIDEYKEEGGRIALRHLKTPKFNTDNHNKTHDKYSKSFNFNDVPACLLTKTVTIAIKEEIPDTSTLSNIKTEVPIKLENEVVVKQEPLSLSQINSQTKKRKKVSNL